MRIFGGHDFYDSALSMGIDPTIVLVREKSKSVPVGVAGGSLLGVRMELLSPGVYLDRVSVVFCGKLYRGVIIKLYRGIITVGHDSCGPDLAFWSADKLRAFASKVKGGKVSIRQSWHSAKTKKKMELEDYFTPVVAPEAVKKYMREHKIAILVEREAELRHEQEFQVNPTGLKQIGFAKALDPYTAFQELSMWIGGVLGGTSPEIVTITDDKILAENHGFDKHSFRSSARIA